MSRIRGKNTSPELLIRKFLFKKGFRYRLHVVNMPGKPDIVLPRYNTVIFINGCFWHGHEGCKYFVLPKTNTEFWTIKIHRNKENDRKNHYSLNKVGWKVVVIWECQLKKQYQAETLSSLVDNLVSI